jgi:hypothetical protein
MKLTKNKLKRLIREELMNEVGMDPIALLKMLCASETIGAALLQEMATQVLENPANVLMALGPYKEQIEQAAGIDLETVVNIVLDFSVDLPFIGAMKLREALAMAAENPMVKTGLEMMIPVALETACQAAESVEATPFQESKKLTNSTLKLLVKEAITADQIRRRDAARAANRAARQFDSGEADASVLRARRADRERFAQGGLPELGGQGLDPDAWDTGDSTRLYDAGTTGVSRPTRPPLPATLGGGAGVNITADNARTQINDLHVSGKIDRETKIAARRALYTPEGEYDPVAGLQVSKEILRSAGVTVNESKQRRKLNVLDHIIRQEIKKLR